MKKLLFILLTCLVFIGCDPVNIVRFCNEYIMADDKIYPFSLSGDTYISEGIGEYKNSFDLYIKLNGYNTKYFKIKNWGNDSLSLNSFADHFVKTSYTSPSDENFGDKPEERNTEKRNSEEWEPEGRSSEEWEPEERSPRIWNSEAWNSEDWETEESSSER